tara:strand:+ start:511 stop:816 length:306 start_codon:yes stop_codon:yes gene_type:complete
MKLTKNFSKSEFDCKSGEDMPSDVLENVKLLAVQLQAIRDYVGKPIRINSAYRSKAHNKDNFSLMLAVLEMWAMGIDLLPRDMHTTFESLNGKFKELEILM